ncbi:MAG: hypothetical protein WBM86_10265 [Waterburya sp.]
MNASRMRETGFCCDAIARSPEFDCNDLAIAIPDCCTIKDTILGVLP